MSICQNVGNGHRSPLVGRIRGAAYPITVETSSVETSLHCYTVITIVRRGASTTPPRGDKAGLRRYGGGDVSTVNSDKPMIIVVIIA